MPQLLVRKVPEQIVEKLKARARANGRSAEEEHRRLLLEALAPKKKPSLKELLLSMPDVGEDADFVFDRGTPREGEL